LAKWDTSNFDRCENARAHSRFDTSVGRSEPCAERRQKCGYIPAEIDRHCRFIDICNGPPRDALSRHAAGALRRRRARAISAKLQNKAIRENPSDINGAPRSSAGAAPTDRAADRVWKRPRKTKLENQMISTMPFRAAFRRTPSHPAQLLVSLIVAARLACNNELAHARSGAGSD